MTADGGPQSADEREPRPVSGEPLVSVVIPVKDGELFLAEAIESVLAQSYERHEIVVVDGGSRDRSREIATSFAAVRVVDQRGPGLPGAWNEGIEATRGELIAFLDSDDRWLPGKLTAQVGLLERAPELGYAICRVRFFLEPGVPVPKGFRPELLEGDYEAPMPSAVLVRQGALEQVGRFDESFGAASDIDWFARFKDSSIELGRVEEVLLEKRVHDRNLSLRAPEYSRQLLRSLRGTVARKRAEADR